MHDYYLCDWCVRSEIEIPELAVWSKDEREPDVFIRLGPAEPVSPDATVLSPFMAVNPDGSVHVDLDDAATLTVRDGREIIVCPRPNGSPNGVRVLILGAGLASLCHQRGLYPLHASCVRWGDGAVAFSGNSGAGKSTMAAALRARGHAILSDDVCAIEAFGDEILVRPAFPRVKLWPDSMALAGLPTENLDPSVDPKNKFHFRFSEAGAFQMEPLPLKAVVFLSAGQPDAAPRLELVADRIQRIAGLNANVSRQGAGLAMGRQGALFQLAGKIAERASIYTLSRGSDLERMEETLALLADRL